MKVEGGKKMVLLVVPFIIIPMLLIYWVEKSPNPISILVLVIYLIAEFGFIAEVIIC